MQRDEDPITVFMGVPTMYSHLLSVYDDMSLEQQKAAQGAAKRLRLTVSGSAACPLPIMQRWHALSGEYIRLPQMLQTSYLVVSLKLPKYIYTNPDG